MAVYDLCGLYFYYFSSTSQQLTTILLQKVQQEFVLCNISLC